MLLQSGHSAEVTGLFKKLRGTSLFSRPWKRVASVKRGLFWITLNSMFKYWQIISRVEVSGKLNFFASFMIDCPGFSLIAAGTAAAISGVLSDRGRPDLGASSREAPDRIFVFIRFTVRRETPHRSATCASVKPDPAAAQAASDKVPLRLIIHD